MGAFNWVSDWVGDFAKSVIPKSVNKGTLPIKEELKDFGLRTVGDLTGVVGRVNPQQQSQNIDPNGVARRPDVAAGQQGANVDKVTRDFLKQFGPAGTPGQGQQRPGLGDVLLAVPGQLAYSILPQPDGALDRTVKGFQGSIIGRALADGVDAVKNAFSSEPDKAAVGATTKSPEPVKAEAAPEVTVTPINLSSLPEPKVTPPTTVPNTPAVTTEVDATVAFNTAAPATAEPLANKSKIAFNGKEVTGVSAEGKVFDFSNNTRYLEALSAARDGKKLDQYQEATLSEIARNMSPLGPSGLTKDDVIAMVATPKETAARPESPRVSAPAAVPG